jgi:hypothetical protein
MKDFKLQESETINEMDKKLILILDIIDNECSADGIIYHHEKFKDLLKLEKEIVKMYGTVVNQNEIIYNIHINLITIIEDVININNKHYNEEPYI